MKIQKGALRRKQTRLTHPTLALMENLYVLSIWYTN